MKYSITDNPNNLHSFDCVIIAITPEQKWVLGDTVPAKPYSKAIEAILKRGDLEASLGSSLLIHSDLDIQRILLIRTEKANTLSATQYNKLLSSAYAALRKTKSTKALSFLHTVEVEQLTLEDKITKNIIACGESGYQYSRKRENAPQALTQLSFMCKKAKSLEDAIDVAEASNLGITLTKELGNAPPNICTPNFLAKEAEKLAKQYKNLTTTILNEAEMKKLGMNALLAVSQGSSEPAKLIIMNYQGAAKPVKPIVLVGKGVTFDSGGISIKPANGMMSMKYDMMGAASVFGTMKALCELGAKQNVIGITPCVENMPDGGSIKPSDVVRSMAGIDIEILNTDAEGRLILADALCYAKKFKPAIVIDLATLTGAAVAALGYHAQPIMGNNQELIDAILKTFNRLGERAWQMPLYEEYHQEIKSKVADIANIATSNRGMGGIMHAGCFLSRFTEDYTWAHLDIAGTAMKDGELATGRPVAALIQFVLNYKVSPNAKS